MHTGSFGRRLLANDATVRLEKYSPYHASKLNKWERQTHCTSFQLSTRNRWGKIEFNRNLISSLPQTSSRIIRAEALSFSRVSALRLPPPELRYIRTSHHGKFPSAGYRGKPPIARRRRESIPVVRLLRQKSASPEPASPTAEQYRILAAELANVIRCAQRPKHRSNMKTHYFTHSWRLSKRV